MPSPITTPEAFPSLRVAVSFAILALATGCGGGGGGTTNPPVGSFTMSASESALTIARNASNSSITITINRIGGL